ncbi:PREDICTED: polypeptide N-acetylgalactosaminyltransferase 5 [Calidris pugnax]|uniref:polypeptide N-acetylgalactosaminyltransferase 5 n=1 Tax=Calidris pugnax TaxID=198806 RepID=UPI00071E4609|nr:PREDICTED: polypeptide N-acetylgalactosaminyltransferase 5 [Calidris pugnax]
MAAGKKANSSGNHFVLVSKEETKPAGPAAPRLGAHPAGNVAQSREKSKEQQLDKENSDGGRNAIDGGHNAIDGARATNNNNGAHNAIDGARATSAIDGGHNAINGAHATNTINGAHRAIDGAHATNAIDRGHNIIDGAHATNATNGAPAANAIDGAPAANAIDGAPAANTIDGAHAANTIDSARIANAIDGAHATNTINGAHITNTINGAHNAIDDALTVNTIMGAAVPGGQGQMLGVTPGAAPGVPATIEERAGSHSPGTHRVLSLDVTLAPRDPQAPGQFGHPVAVPDDKQEEAKSRWKEGNFNVYLSDLIPVDRAIADTRPAGCSQQRVHDDLPTTTIIMCFVDEVWSTLLRSVHSVLGRSPPHLIEEVILVDDCSTKEYLKEKLDRYMSRFPKVKILHLKERHGLIRARLAGAEIAKGTVLTFLDSHVECNVGWLEPLLERVHLSRTKVACPVIEVISDKDMSYMTVDNFQRGIFTWPMNFGWRQIPQEVVEKNKIKETDIIRCPVMAGGLFSIDKKYFFELGAYDPGLDVWGGENMEISFKVWMCGGEIEIVPCSRVGHIFRNDNPYSFPKDRVRTVERNLARVAEVWLDEYKELFYGHAYHLVLKKLDVGNLTQQIQLRKKLQCKSFRWYLENVYPDLEAPLVKASGLLVNIATARCITVHNTTLASEACDVNSKDQKFNYTWLRLIQHRELCLALTSTAGALGLQRCQGGSHSPTWLHKSLATTQPDLTEHIVWEHLQQPACLEVDPSHGAPRVTACDSANPYQKWQFGNYHAD